MGSNAHNTDDLGGSWDTTAKVRKVHGRLITIRFKKHTKQSEMVLTANDWRLNNERK